MCLVIYVNDIIPIENNYQQLKSTKGFLQNPFVTKDIGHLGYFIRIKV